MGLFKGARRVRAFRCFFATDIHGSDRCFRKFLAASTIYGAEALILGGDIAGKAIVPVVEDRQHRHYRLAFQGSEQRVDPADLESRLASVRYNGLYPYVCSSHEHEELIEDSSRLTQVFESLIRAQLRCWSELAAERLDPSTRCIVTPGNDDPRVIDEVLATCERIECPERDIAALGPVSLASLGNTNRTPWNTEREFDEPELARQIAEMLASWDIERRLVFNFHCPPYDSGLDTVVKLDPEFRPVFEQGVAVEAAVGSTSVRDAILRYEPIVGLHGHIHEARGVRRVGSTVCINPGSDYSAGTLKGAIVDFDAEGQLVDHLLTTG